MQISKEQLEQIKKQLIEQINTNFPEDKKLDAIEKIDSMDEEQLIEFLKQNNLIQESQTNPKQTRQCIFCSIVFGDVPSTKIGENEKAIAILELNPISEGHTIIIPKEHILEPEAMPKEALKLAQETKRNLFETLLPEKVELINSEITGHQIINVIPIYDDESMDSKRGQKTPQDLKKLKERIEKSKHIPKNIGIEKEPEKIPEQKTQVFNEKDIKLPKRIP